MDEIPLRHNDLLELYWSNNTADEMMDALDAFRTVQGLEKRNDGALDAVLAADAVLPDKISRTHWGRRPSHDFYPAWAYWNFAKGYRYILQIPNPGAYVCHWLREDACTEGAKYETIFGKRDLLKGLFPWGLVLGEVAQRFKLHTSADAMYGAIMELRTYTKENLKHLSIFEEPAEDKLDILRERTAEFVQGAMTRIAPPKWESLLQGKRLENIVLVPYIVGQLGLAMSFSEMRTGLDLVLTPETARTGETRDAIITETLVRLSRYRKTARGFVARYEREFMSFWQERGWI